ncbi:hypothetical protein BKA62DRAFT_731178, partial [Auriculariales sp. MPI-PUGE-AT-0066]
CLSADGFGLESETASLPYGARALASHQPLASRHVVQGVAHPVAALFIIPAVRTAPSEGSRQEHEDRYPPINPESFTEFEKKQTLMHVSGTCIAIASQTSTMLFLMAGTRRWTCYSFSSVSFLQLPLPSLLRALSACNLISGEITAKGVIMLLARTDSSIVAPALPSTSQPESNAHARWINGLWYASLTLALLDALLAILGKQWLVEYASKATPACRKRSGLGASS